MNSDAVDSWEANERDNRRERLSSTGLWSCHKECRIASLTFTNRPTQLESQPTGWDLSCFASQLGLEPWQRIMRFSFPPILLKSPKIPIALPQIIKVCFAFTPHAFARWTLLTIRPSLFICSSWVCTFPSKTFNWPVDSPSSCTSSTVRVDGWLPVASHLSNVHPWHLRPNKSTWLPFKISCGNSSLSVWAMACSSAHASRAFHCQSWWLWLPKMASKGPMLGTRYESVQHVSKKTMLLIYPVWIWVIHICNMPTIEAFLKTLL